MCQWLSQQSCCQQQHCRPGHLHHTRERRQSDMTRDQMNSTGMSILQYCSLLRSHSLYLQWERSPQPPSQSPAPLGRSPGRRSCQSWCPLPRNSHSPLGRSRQGHASAGGSRWHFERSVNDIYHSITAVCSISVALCLLISEINELQRIN